MIRVAVISAPGPELANIREQLSATRFTVKLFSSLSEIEVGLRNFKAQILIVRFHVFSEAQFAITKRIRDTFTDCAVIACADTIEDAFRFRVLKEPRLCVANLVYELIDLPDLISRLAAGDSGPRAHARARRFEKIEIHNSSGRVLQGKFLDFGKMGAKIQVASGGLKPNDRVMLKYHSSSNEKVRKIEALVVWKAAPSGLGASLLGTHTLGVKFIAYI